jgi:uncharacterized protein (DUF433 family)
MKSSATFASWIIHPFRVIGELWENQAGGLKMKEQQLLERITLNPKVMAGKPVIKGTRLTVEYILGLLAQGATPAEILEEYDGLTPEDLQACFLFATKSLSETEFMPLMTEAA